MSTGELTAWQAGVDWGRDGRSGRDLTRASYRTLMSTLGPDACQALAGLGSDVFRYWAFRGLDDFHATGRG